MPRTIAIYTENDIFQTMEALRRNREKRQRRREFIIEGVRPINLALRHGWTINAWIYDPRRRFSDWALGILRHSNARTHYELPPQLLAKLSGKDEPGELLALAAMPEDDPWRVPLHDDLLALVFDRPASPGNLGTLLRSCDALGAHGLFITGHAADLYDPETISASTGSLFATPAVRLPAQRDLASWLDAARSRYPNLQIVGSDEKGDHEIAAHDFRRPTVLVLGNETWGMSAAYRELCDVLVRIPIGGSASSLNVAVAASIMLYEIARQRRAAAR